MNPIPDFGCRSLRFKKSEGECAPQRYVFKEIFLPMGTELTTHDCRYECLMESKCLSVNIGPPNKTGFRLCQLSTFDHTQHREDKEIRKGFILWASENSCSSNPCLHDSTCLNGYTDKRYICLCPHNYTGENCEKDKNECIDNTHDCHAKAVCSNTEGSFTCNCIEGYQGNGRNCTDVDECTSHIHGCHYNASCNNTDGSYTCKCKPGLSCTFKAVFSNLNATGRYGPTSLGSYYASQDHDEQVALSSGIQKWTVPHTGDYRIEAIGAAGGYDVTTNSSRYRGRGARMIGTFHLNKGEVTQIIVGQEGGINKMDESSGGGGGTFVVRGADTPLIIAGGGGGIDSAKSRHVGCDASTNTTGNPGYRSWSGGINGHGAQTPSANSVSSGGGGGGFYSSGRSGINFNGTEGDGGEGGKGFLQGGVGGRSRYYDVDGGFGGGGGAEGFGGGGGGGGYSGGSSGDFAKNTCGGGGGSYNVGNNQQNECCYNKAGHGQVTITLL
ncbi:ALK tyrosine kinase receptor-like [Pocillopora verrucosa]|uniref:ALK tyrosine kinase receptor-like n=1 Tax=Pocillopora verrucosa TaxID=203993 RepID=UPI003341A96A